MGHQPVGATSQDQNRVMKNGSIRKQVPASPTRTSLDAVNQVREVDILLAAAGINGVLLGTKRVRQPMKRAAV